MVSKPWSHVKIKIIGTNRAIVVRKSENCGAARSCRISGLIISRAEAILRFLSAWAHSWSHSNLQAYKTVLSYYLLIGPNDAK